jgi:hypothetical protein
MQRSWRLVAALALVARVAGVGAGQAQEGTEPRLRTTAMEIEFAGRVQTQFSTTSVDTLPAGEIFIRRARLETRARVNRLVTAKIQAEFASGAAVLQDANLRFDFHPALGLLAGRAFRPFGLVQQTSSLRILPIERGLRIRGVDGFEAFELMSRLRYSDRDVGFQLFGAPAGAPLGLAYQAGVFAGPLHRQVGAQNSYQLAARATVAPLDRLRAGAGWSGRDFARSTGAGRHELRRGNAFEVDLEYGAFAPGLHLIGELTWGDFDPFAGERFLGAQGWLAYRTGALSEAVTGIEPVFRASHGAIDRGAGSADPRGGTLLTPGLNVYFGPLNRIMLNFDHWTPAGGRAEGSFKVQVQAAF